jgi:hypothetical protein
MTGPGRAQRVAELCAALRYPRHDAGEIERLMGLVRAAEETVVSAEVMTGHPLNLGAGHHVTWTHDLGRVVGRITCSADADAACRTRCETHRDAEDCVSCAVTDLTVTALGCLLESGGPCGHVTALEEDGPAEETYGGVDRAVRAGPVLIGRSPVSGQWRWCYAECSETHVESSP